MRLQLRIVAVLICGGAALFCLTSRTLLPTLCDPQRPLTVGRSQQRFFTLSTISHAARLRSLRSWVQHYSRCAPVTEILIVWTKGPPPQIETLGSSKSVRLRIAPQNSLLQRFQPDSAITTPVVLSLDDDIYMTCRDLQKGFDAFQASPAQLVGYHPRLVEGQPLLYRGEGHAKQARRFNTILTGAVFLEHAKLFPHIMAAELAPLRALVDDLMNGEDLLMNFVVANLTRGSHLPYAEAIPVRWRIHARRLIRQGISTNEVEHFRRRSQCLEAFSRHFGGSPLRDHALPSDF